MRSGCAVRPAFEYGTVQRGCDTKGHAQRISVGLWIRVGIGLVRLLPATCEERKGSGEHRPG